MVGDLVPEAEADVVYKLNGENSVMQVDVQDLVVFGINLKASFQIMKNHIENLGKILNKSQQKNVTGGFGFWPTTKEQCMLCGGEWEAPLCALPMNSVCL
ncbi:protein of unknown function [Tenacibaculum sp. 190130A14a]|uniref:Uncharacterized protein n=2 Tax=Tenacibaculum polynesiense TaxID=3137857 RepID=A0ABM9PGH0_9FLAO